MSVSEVRTPLREVRWRVISCCAVICLSIDELNPVKQLSNVLNIEPRVIAFISAVFFFTILYANASELVYFCVKVFFHSTLSIYFSSMESIGLENIPAHGPVIFTGNHMNQFVDGAVIVITSPRKVGFLVAEKSMQKPIIGDFSRALGSIGVARPQDYAKRGEGRIMFDRLKLFGEGTAFTTALKPGDKIRPGKSPEAYRVEVVSDTEANLFEDSGETSPLTEPQKIYLTYDILEHVDQAHVFRHVHEALADGGCIGIFPEGGSHDNTELLPLKAGVAAIAFGALEKYDVNVRIVPVGLNYFRGQGHRFRKRVVVEFGAPIRINPAMYEVYKEKKNRRQAYQMLLSAVEDGMKAVVVTARTYDDLKLIHTLRRLYQKASDANTLKDKQVLSRKFSIAHRMILDANNGELPPDLAILRNKLEEYQTLLDDWGIKDYQVHNLHVPFSKIFYAFIHCLTVWLLASIPNLLLNAPVGIAAYYWAYEEAKKDLKASRVKIKARDVLMSKQIYFALIAVPILWLSYALLLFLFTSLEPRTILIFLLSCPFFSYLGVQAVEAGMVDMKDLRPAFLRLLPAFRRVVEELPMKRAHLQAEVRVLVKKYGPSCGDLYFQKDIALDQFMRQHLSTVDLSNLMPETHEGGEARITTEAAVEASEAAAVSAYNTVAGAVSDLISSFPSSKKDE